MSRGSEWYARHKDERTIKMGDRMRVLSLIHNAHAAATELLDDAVVRDGGMLGWAAKKVNRERYQFMKRATTISHTSFRDRHAGTARATEYPERRGFRRSRKRMNPLPENFESRWFAGVATAEARFPRNFPNAFLHTGRESAMPHPTWQDLYNAAFLEIDLAKLPERVASEFINTE